MAKRHNARKNTSIAAPKAGDNQADVAPEITTVLVKVRTSLEQQRPEEALHVIARCRLKSPWLTNAAGVCQLRLGNARQAVSAFQTLAVASTILLKQDAPMVFKTNYAVALVAAGNLVGGLSVLAEIRAEENPTVVRLRAAIYRWKQSLSFWQKIRWYLGDDVGKPVPLDFPLGDVE